MCRWRHKIRKIAVEILHSVNNRTQSLWEIAYYAWLLLTYIVINTLLGRATRHPAGMHCPAGDDAFVSSYYIIITLRSIIDRVVLMQLCQKIAGVRDFLAHGVD